MGASTARCNCTEETQGGASSHHTENAADYLMLETARCGNCSVARVACGGKSWRLGDYGDAVFVLSPRRLCLTVLYYLAVP